MLTIKLKIDKCDNRDLLAEYVSEYTKLFYKLYNNAELLSDKTFINDNLSSKIDKSIYDFCVSDVLTKLNQHQTNIDNKKKEIEQISNLLINESFKTKNEKRKKYKLLNKLRRLEKNINNNITFGGKNLLRDITKLSQLKNKTIEQIKLLEDKKILFRENRKIGLYLVGRACENGNRKIDFDLINKKIIFKPNKNNKITIEFHSSSKNRNTILSKLQLLTEINQIPLTVRIDNDYVYISYDETIVSGYNFDRTKLKNEQLGIEDKFIKKNIYKKHIEELNNRKLEGKIKNRYLSFDLNPKSIGLVVFDYINDKNEQKIIHKELIDLSNLSAKLKLESSNPSQIKQNNKRKHEIKEVWKYIFNLVKHYKVYNVVMEDLNFNNNNNNNNGKEFNKQTKNLWHRTLTISLIKKYCNIIGLNLIEVNPVYSSFIGNMIHVDLPDAVSSAIEIGRRGATKYIKGSSIYPNISLINREKLDYLLDENIDLEGFTWIKLYRVIHLLRYRNPILKKIGLLDNYLYSKKSKVNRFIIY